MRESRGGHGFAGFVGVLTLLALVGQAVAAPGSADLVARGIVAEGPTAIVADAGWLLLRDPGQEAFDQVRVQVPAPAAKVIVHRVSEYCIARAAGTGSFALPAMLDRRSPLDPAAAAQARVEGIAADPLGAAMQVPLAARATSALPVDVPGALDALPLVAHTARTAAAAPGPVPLPPGVPAPCMADPQGQDRRTEHEVTNLVLTAVPRNGYYTLLWQGADAEGVRGTALLQARGPEFLVQREDQTVRIIADDAWRQFDAVAHQTIPAGVLRAEAAEGRGSFFGDGTLWVYNARVDVSGDDFTQTYETGEGQGSDPLTGQGRRVITYLEVRLTGAAGSFESPAPVEAYAPAFSATVDGALQLREARGTVRSGDSTRQLHGEAFALEGDFAARLTPALDGQDAKRGWMSIQGSGDMVTLASAGPAPEAQPVSVSTAAAAVSLAAIAAGAMAYFWPALKWLLAPLYTRIPTDALLMHEARERIYKLIKAEPGIHAHEIAARLDLGWGTAVYHLKLLERNGLVVARHEGRYKRFFVTGDQRIQRKEAVALLRNATSRSIAAQVAQQPGLIQKQVCEALSLSPSLASWHLQRLEAASVVRAERVGRAVRYQPGPAWTELQEMDGHAAPAPAPAATPIVVQGAA